MASKVDPERLGVHALGDDQNIPLRVMLGVIRDEISELQGAAGGGGALADRVTALEASVAALGARVTALETAAPPA